jgi:hypothetical protein
VLLGLPFISISTAQTHSADAGLSHGHGVQEKKEEEFAFLVWCAVA